jgi:hypothetical protein
MHAVFQNQHETTLRSTPHGWTYTSGQEPTLLPVFLLLQLGNILAPYRINPGLQQVKVTNDWMIV